MNCEGIGGDVTDRGFQTFHVTTVFRVPLPFAYRWCTDYSPDDATLAGEDRTIGLRRMVVTRTVRRVVFENVYDHGKGWAWERHSVTLMPPDRWHSDAYGNYHEVHLDYRLRGLPDGRTRFEMRWRSRPLGPSGKELAPRRSVERFVRRLWRLRARVLERDYQKSLEIGPSPRGRRRPERSPRRTRA